MSGQLRVLMTIVTVMVIIDAAWAPVVLLTALLAPEFYSAAITPVASEVDIGQVVFSVLTMIVFGRWIYVAGRNLRDAGVEDLEFTPASRIWWFAVPFANLVKPFQGMRELWNASHGIQPYDVNHGLIGVWWALWLLNGLAGNIAMRSEADEALYAISALGVVLAPVALTIVRGITFAQERMGTPSLEEVFA